MQPDKLLRSLFLKSATWFGLMGILLFAAAGDWRWPQGWAFVVIFFLGSILFSLWLMRRDPALLAARLGPLSQQGQPLWDKIFLLVFVLVWFGWLALMGLDARRWHSSEMPLWLNGAGGLLVILGYLATMRVFRENSFAAPVVRLQSERGQRVIDGGPYALVRHPMYASALIYLVGMPLLLGSWYGLLGVPLFLAGLASRAVAEEKLLKRELPGYADYMSRVRFRLIPGIW
ncbi:MAG TPA: isoprenylcysteine carboxylmethyltransferase family protein [Rhizomicrobium sp.]|nr:isoprenylcysteine carboxylmethyltransferase family protein [Rhizomicrobium sp.]